MIQINTVRPLEHVSPILVADTGPLTLCPCGRARVVAEKGSHESRTPGSRQMRKATGAGAALNGLWSHSVSQM